MTDAAPVTLGRANLISAFTMLATVMVGLDSTIANVALPHMQATVSASQDEISWVITSYVVSSAIAASLTGFLVDRIGRTRLYVISLSGFTIASILCGSAESLGMLVASRTLQGLCGATMIPLSQAVVMTTYPTERQAPAMAV